MMVTKSIIFFLLNKKSKEKNIWKNNIKTMENPYKLDEKSTISLETLLVRNSLPSLFFAKLKIYIQSHLIQSCESYIITYKIRGCIQLLPLIQTTTIQVVGGFDVAKPIHHSLVPRGGILNQSPLTNSLEVNDANSV